MSAPQSLRRQERVLVVSDSRAVMDVIETVWRSGNAAVAKSRDRGAMIEAICALRAQLGCVLFVWTPGLRQGIPGYATMRWLTL